MAKRLLFGLMALASLAMLLFVGGFVFLKLGIGFVGSFLYWLAGKLMLLAFAGLLVMAVTTLLLTLWRDVRDYFSAEARALRRLLGLRVRALNARCYLLEQTRQLRFWSGLKRKASLRTNDRKHLRGLFLAIDADLRQAKNQLPKVAYRRLHKALRHYHRRADIAAMLALREQLPCR